MFALSGHRLIVSWITLFLEDILVFDMVAQ